MGIYWLAMDRDTVDYFHRYRDRIEREEIYGERWLRWAYTTAAGNLLVESIIKRSWFSMWYGWRMNRRGSAGKVLPFCRKYGIDEFESAIPPKDFTSFNAFFTRHLEKGRRPIESDPSWAVFPADGRHFALPRVSASSEFFAKGQHLDLNTLIADEELASEFRDGTLILSRLCPVDYHRFHFPVDGTPGGVASVNGPLYSVNPVALRRNMRFLTENRRMRTVLETENFGKVLLFEVGATCVGRIEQTFAPGHPVIRGDEKGYFSFGGSAVITVFQEGRIALCDDLLKNNAEGREVYAHMGDRMGRMVAKPEGKQSGGETETRRA
jgi:phosphatidylserine decarboxylase